MKNYSVIYLFINIQSTSAPLPGRHGVSTRIELESSEDSTDDEWRAALLLTPTPTPTPTPTHNPTPTPTPTLKTGLNIIKKKMCHTLWGKTPLFDPPCHIK